MLTRTGPAVSSPAFSCSMSRPMSISPPNRLRSGVTRAARAGSGQVARLGDADGRFRGGDPVPDRVGPIVGQPVPHRAWHPPTEDVEVTDMVGGVDDRFGGKARFASTTQGAIGELDYPHEAGELHPLIGSRDILRVSTLAERPLELVGEDHCGAKRQRSSWIVKLLEQGAGGFGGSPVEFVTDSGRADDFGVLTGEVDLERQGHDGVLPGTVLVELPVDRAVGTDLVVMADEVEKFLVVAIAGTPVSDKDKGMGSGGDGDRY